MHQIAVISDTHIPTRAAEIPAASRDRIRDADHVVHAGDFTTDSILADIKSLANGDLTAVTGNMDPGSLALPPVATLTIEAVTFVVTHGTGDPQGYEERVVSTVRETAGKNAIGIAGHTHEVLNATSNGIRVLNPGSVTGAAPATSATMMTVDVDGDDFTVTVHEDG